MAKHDKQGLSKDEQRDVENDVALIDANSPADRKKALDNILLAQAAKTKGKKRG